VKSGCGCQKASRNAVKSGCGCQKASRNAVNSGCGCQKASWNAVNSGLGGKNAFQTLRTEVREAKLPSEEQVTLGGKCAQVLH